MCCDGTEYYYNVNTSFAPSGVYSKDIDIKEQYVRRDVEISTLIHDIINDTIMVNRKPTIFNKKKGYIILTVDGLETIYWVRQI